MKGMRLGEQWREKSTRVKGRGEFVERGRIGASRK